MNTSHTPGPWEIIQDAPENPKARFQIGHRKSPTSATYVCTLRAEKTITHDGKQAANARMIAAAPDLLATLQTILEHGEPRAKNSQTAIGCVEWAATFGPLIRAAIAKATQAP